MSENVYYFNTIKKLVAGFGMLFSDINITRHYDDNTIKHVKVPLNYGSRHAWYASLKRRMHDKEGAAKFARQLPRISYELGDLAYANDRKVPTLIPTIHREENVVVDKIYRQYSPIPWDFSFTVSIAVKNIEDGLRIIEQIVPKFRPDHTITIEEIPNLVKEDVTVNMVGISSSDEYEGSLSDVSRVITWDLQFVAHGHIMPPLRDSKLIEQVESLVKDDIQDLQKYTATDTTESWTDIDNTVEE